MFKKFFEAVRSLFSAFFPSSSKENPKKDNTPKEDLPDIPQDGSEIRKDTIVIISNEMDEVIIDPNTPDKEFDEDIFNEPDKEEPKPEEKEPEPPVQKKGRYLWCLDNGHGSQTPGKRSPVFDDGETQLFEYEFNRDIVRRIIEALDKEGIQYFNVVPEVDIDNFLEGRVDRANNKKSDIPKIYLSIHANAAPAPSIRQWGPDSVHGIETWFYHGSKKGQKLAAVFQQKLIDKTSWRSRGLKSQPKGQFFVLRKTKMTAVLTENGFYNNKAQALDLMKEEVRQKIADAHVEAILEIEKNGI